MTTAYRYLPTKKHFYLSNEKIFYVDAAGKEYKMDQKDVKELVVDNERYTLLPITEKKNRLLTVIASNEKYILSVYTFTGSELDGGATPEEYHLYVHDKNTLESLAPRIRYNNVSTNYDNMLPTIKKYFANCTSLTQQMEANSVKQSDEKKLRRKGPFEGISDLKCGQ